jgi:cell division protein FtsL
MKHIKTNTSLTYSKINTVLLVLLLVLALGVLYVTTKQDEEIMPSDSTEISVDTIPGAAL